MEITKITDTNWECLAQSIAEKQTLFDYAAEKGIVLAYNHTALRYDRDLYLCYWYPSMEGEAGLMANVESEPEYKRIDASAFRQMCDDYAASSSTGQSAA